MTTPMEQRLERCRQLEELRALRGMGGLENDPAMDVIMDVAQSGLPSAKRAIEMGMSHCFNAALARQLTPSAPLRRTPPANQPFVIIGQDAVTGDDVFLLHQELCRGVTIVGSTGSGKTVTLFGLLRGLPEAVFLYAPDTKREIWRIFRNLSRRSLYVRPNQRYVNVLECPTADPVTYYTGLMDVLSRILELDDATWPEVAALLIEVRMALPKDKPMLALAEFPPLLRATAERRKKAKFNTAAAKFLVLAIAYGDAAWVRRGPDLATRYSALGMDYSGVAHKVRHATDAHYLYAHMQVCTARGHNTDLDFLLVCDEGLDLFGRVFGSQPGSGHVSFQDMVGAQGRSFGFGRVALFQYAGQGDANALANSSSIIALPISEPIGAKAVAGILNMPPESAQMLQDLPPLEGFAKTPTFTPATPLTVKYTELGRFASDAEIQTAMEPEIRWMRENSIMAPRQEGGGFTDIDYSALLGYSAEPIAIESATPSTPPPQVPPSEPPIALVADWATFLRGVAANPDANTSGLYAAIGLSGYRGNKIKGELLAAGLITVVRVKTTGRPAERIEMTNLGEKSLAGFRK